jgi:thioredoxin reductase (NADPH)
MQEYGNLDYDVVIIGAGPAGLTAGLYLSQSKYRTIALERKNFGGQIMNIDKVENYPGFANGVAGAVLGSEMLSQATGSGLEINLAEVIGIDSYNSGWKVKCIGTDYTAKVVIIAGGMERKKLDIPGEAEFTGKGVSYCALCDASFSKGKQVAIVGGGNAAVTEALYLSKFASKLVIIHRRNKLRATRILQEKAFAEPKIEFIWDTAVEEIAGDKFVNRIKLRQVMTMQESFLDISSIFIATGVKPNTDYLKGVLPLDETGAIITNQRMETETPCILAAGDIRSGSPHQIVTAVGDGATAAISAERLLQELS